MTRATSVTTTPGRRGTAGDDYTGSDAAWDVWTRYDAGRRRRARSSTRSSTTGVARARPFVKPVSIGTTHLGRADLGAEGHQGRRRGGPTARPAVLYNAHAARARVARGRDLPPHARLLRRQLRRHRRRPSTSDGDEIAGVTARGDHAARRQERAVVRRASPTRTATTTRSRPTTACGARTCATTTATAVHGDRRTASTRTATSRRTGATTTRAPRTTRRRRPTAAPAPPPSPRRRRWTASGTASTSSSRSTTTRRRAAAVPARLPAVHADARRRDLPGAGRHRRRLGDRRQGVRRGRPEDASDESWRSRTARSTRTRRATASTRTSGPSSTSPTARRSTTRTTSTAPSPSRRRAREPADGDARVFEFQDAEADIEAEFQRNILFALDLAHSAARPGEPVSHLGNGVRDFEVDDFAISYGDPQSVEVDAKRSSARCACATASTAAGAAGADEGGDGRRAVQQRAGRLLPPPARRGEGHQARRRGRGVVRGRRQEHSQPLHLHGQAARRRNKVLILAAEDYLAGNPAQDPDGPHYLSYYTDALEANGVGYDVYDVDRMGRHGAGPARRAQPLRRGDLVHGRRLPDPRAGPAGRAPGTARLADEEIIAVRDFLNEGGKLLYTGKRAGLQYAEGNEFRNFGFPEPDGRAGRRARRRTSTTRSSATRTATDKDPSTDAFDTWPEFDEDDPTLSDGCIAHNDDFLQYYLGAYIYVSGGNTALETEEGDYLPFNMTGTGGAVRGPHLGLRRDRGGQPGPHGHVRRHELAARPAAVPAVRRLARASRAGCARAPAVQPVQRPVLHGLERAQRRRTSGWARPSTSPARRAGADVQVLLRPGAGLGLHVGRGARADDDGDPSNDVWTTLPDTQRAHGSTETGDSCAEGLANGRTPCTRSCCTTTTPTCEPTADTGPARGTRSPATPAGWPGLDGRPHAVRRQQVEVSITNITDWGTLGLGHVDRRREGDASTARSPSRPTSRAAPAAGPPRRRPRARSSTTPTGPARPQQFTEGGGRRHRLTRSTPASASRASSAAARPEFMKRAPALPRRAQGQPRRPAAARPGARGGGGTPGSRHATAMRISASKLRVDPSAGAQVRLSCGRRRRRGLQGHRRAQARQEALMGRKSFTHRGQQDRRRHGTGSRSRAYRRLKRGKTRQDVTLTARGSRRRPAHEVAARDDGPQRLKKAAKKKR